MEPHASFMGLPTELRVQIYRRVLDVPDTPVIMACCVHHAHEREVGTDRQLWHGEASAAFWDCLYDLLPLLSVNKHVKAEIDANVFSGWELGMCLSHLPPVYERDLLNVADAKAWEPCLESDEEPPDLALIPWRQNTELHAWTRCFKNLMLTVDFASICTDGPYHKTRLRGESIDTARCLVRILNEVNQPRHLRVDVCIVDRQEFKNYGPFCAREQLADYLSVFEELQDHIDLDLWLCDSAAPATEQPPQGWWLTGKFEMPSTDYLETLNGNQRSRHFVQDRKWLLDEWNQLRVWTERVFCCELVPAWANEASLEPNFDFMEIQVLFQKDDLLFDAWEAQRLGHEEQLMMVKDKLVVLLKDCRDVCVQLLYR